MGKKKDKTALQKFKEFAKEEFESGFFVGIVFSLCIGVIVILIFCVLIWLITGVYLAFQGDIEAIITMIILGFLFLWIIIFRLWVHDKLKLPWKSEKDVADWEEFLKWKAENDQS